MRSYPVDIEADGRVTVVVEPEADRRALLQHRLEEGALILAGTARFLAAHTPTRREQSQVVSIATRLRRGEAWFEEP